MEQISRKTIHTQISDRLYSIKAFNNYSFTTFSLDKIEEECYEIVELTKIARKYINNEKKGD